MKKSQILIYLFSICIISGTAYADLTDGLVTYFPFNGNAHDESGYGNDGSVYGAELTTDRHGNSRSAYFFDTKKNSWIKAKADGLPTGERTVSLWFYAINVYKSTLLGYGGKTCGTSWLMLINVDDGGNDSYQVQSHCRVNRLLSSYSQAPIGKWYHWVITTSSNGTIMYIDGNKICESTLFINNTYVKEKDLAIGIISGPNGLAPFIDRNCSYFSGMIDDVRIYNRSLSTAEVQELYDLEKTNECENINDSDDDGVIDKWDICENTPLNSFVNKNGCPANDSSDVSGRISIKGKPLTKGNAMLIQSGETFQKVPVDNNGCFKFDRVVEEKAINIMIRKPID